MRNGLIPTNIIISSKRMNGEIDEKYDKLLHNWWSSRDNVNVQMEIWKNIKDRLMNEWTKSEKWTYVKQQNTWLDVM